MAQPPNAQAVDVWSLGCIFAELLSMQAESVPNHRERAPLFPGKSCFPLSVDQARPSCADKLDQLNVIFDVIGACAGAHTNSTPSRPVRFRRRLDLIHHRLARTSTNPTQARPRRRTWRGSGPSSATSRRWRPGNRGRSRSSTRGRTRTRSTCSPACSGACAPGAVVLAPSQSICLPVGSTHPRPSSSIH